MADLKVTNKSKQYLFKDKLPLAKKSRSRLIRESIYMLIISIVLFIISSYIPAQETIFNTFSGNLLDLYNNSILFIVNLGKIILVLLLVASKICAYVLLIGGLYRIYKVFKRKANRAIFRK